VFIILTVVSGIGKVLRYWQAILLLAVVQLFAAWILANPLTSTIHDTWDHSMIVDSVTAGNMPLSVVQDELLISSDSSMEIIYHRTLFIVTGLGYLFVSMFILAGLLPLYAGLDLKFNWDRFWSDAARFYKPFIGLAIISIAFYAAADFISNTTRSFVIDSLANSNDEAIVFIATVLFTHALRFILFALVVMIFQYAKIISATEQLRNVIYLIRRAFSFVGKFFLKIIILYAILSVLEFGVLLLDISVWHYMLAKTDMWIQLLWIVVATLLFVVVKFSFFACQSILYEETRRVESESGSIRLGDSSYSYMDES
jgi:hypothetical protein